MSAQHTPSPWEWWTSNSWRRLRHSNRGVSSNVILPTVAPDGQPDLLVSDDDACLIAAAPDLLEALQAIMDERWSPAGRSERVSDMARAAIAKATQP